MIARDVREVAYGIPQIQRLASVILLRSTNRVEQRHKLDKQLSSWGLEKALIDIEQFSYIIILYCRNPQTMGRFYRILRTEFESLVKEFKS
jgi:hypothetical protein